MFKIGDILHLRGLTLRGKNRIARGGHWWRVRKITDAGWLLESEKVGEREMFWMTREERNVLVLEVQ